MSCFLAALAFAGAAVVVAEPALAQPNWIAERVNIGPVAEIRQVGDDVFVRGARWFEAVDCDGALCLVPGRPPAERAPRNGIPDGMIAEAGGAGIIAAWYEDPTTRYQHGILGDAIEAATLVGRDAEGNEYRFEAALNRVFEDLTPRIADIDGDGLNDIVAIRSDTTLGAAFAVFGLADGALIELAAIFEIGLANRWLNVAGIADFNGDGRLDIAIVKTPHIGGTLEIWTWRNGDLVRLASAGGFSNHAIGSTEQDLSAIVDFTGDGVVDLALPDASRTALRFVTLNEGAITDVGAVPVGGEIGTAIGTLVIGGAPAFIAGLSDGTAILVRQSR